MTTTNLCNVISLFSRKAIKQSKRSIGNHTECIRFTVSRFAKYAWFKSRKADSADRFERAHLHINYATVVMPRHLICWKIR